MTEAFPVIRGSLTKRGDYPGSCGVIVPNTEVKVIATDDGRELEQGETGEICVRGPQVREEKTVQNGGFLEYQRRFLPILMVAFTLDDPKDAWAGPVFLFELDLSRQSLTPINYDGD